MGRLEDVYEFLDTRLGVIISCEDQLKSLQEKFESFFAEVSRAREHELDQLVAETLHRREELPQWYLDALNEAAPEVEKEITEKRRKLVGRRNYRRKKAAKLREESIEAEAGYARQSREHNTMEEHMVERITDLENRIGDLEKEIRTLSKGLGFFTNIARGRQLDRKRRELDAERRKLASQLEKLRGNWRDHLIELKQQDETRRRYWITAENEAAALSAQIEALDLERPRILARTVVEKLVGQRHADLVRPAPTDPPCRRCGMPNSPENSFCYICALRLKEDRPDFEGSLAEIAELNRHHERFAEGIKAGQEILGLVGGIRSGHEALLKSVHEMIRARDDHDLGNLELDVPEDSRRYGEIFDELAEILHRDQRLHPLHFARKVGKLIEGRLTEEKLKNYFEQIGKALSAAAAARWD